MRALVLGLLLGCAGGRHQAPTAGANLHARDPAATLGDAPPAAAPAPPLRLPPVTRRQLANGLRVWTVEHHAVPRVAVVLAVRAGADVDPPGKAGLAALCADMLDEGAGGRGALAIAEALDDEGAQLGISTSSAATLLTLWSLSDRANLESSLAVLGDVVVRPDFARRELDRVRADRLTEILQGHDEPELVAGHSLAQALYGKDHVYGSPLIGRTRTLASVKHADVKRFWRAHYRPDNAALIVAGAIRPDELVPMLERALGGWTARPLPPTQAPRAPERRGPRLVIVDRPGAPQSEVRLGHVGLERGHPDEFVVEVLGTLLGGSFASRLNNRLREQLGYTYGAWGGFDLRRGPGPFVMGAAVRTDATAAAVTEFFAEVHRIREREPADEEVARARDGLLRSLPQSFEGASAIATRLADLFAHGLDAEYFDHYVERIGAVTAADVQRAARDHIRPEEIHVIVVGDRAALQDLSALDLGVAQVWDAEGNETGR